MNRVVLDTNIIVSALLVPTGTQASVLLLALGRPNVLYVSEPVLAEYDEVLRRRRLKLQQRQIDEALAAIRKVANLVAPTQTLSVSADESDNRFLRFVLGVFYVRIGPPFQDEYSGKDDYSPLCRQLKFYAPAFKVFTPPELLKITVLGRSRD